MAVTVQHIPFWQTFQLRKSEWLLAILMTAYGVMTLLYPGMFEKSPTLANLLVYFPQIVWGWVMTLVGAAGWYALARNGFWKRSPLVRTVCAILRGIVWFQLFLALATSGEPSWGLVAFLIYMAFEGVNTWYAGADHALKRQQLKSQSL
jgi:hypothetical protein